ncbi:caspase domain protein [Synechococcus sp. PCC 7335]|uniref:nSTAND1 domain-containing NTPase n=1 Tax=Synechococcus sp. (strain ATCC 29403 / PCC 7335) TaxID=91464 RepID=UPI00017EDA07|nr:pentapeptide repeat-containing protein [Synechococcus sp. PCC 7335]EDX82830.1 caspase domain protein [Synechococcus sp. PCC 7335]
MSRNALVVGISCYQQLSPLTAPVKDAEAIAQRLEQASDFKVQRLPERILEAGEGKQEPAVSATQPVTQRQLKQVLKQLFLPDSQQLPETALFYFSGHGLASDDGHDKGYLATSDTDPNSPVPGLPLGWLHWLLSASPVRQQVIWLDCCHSGSLIVNVDAANPGSGGSRHRCFIASSRDFESSWEDLNSPYSVLTKALLTGLEPDRLSENSVNSFDLVAHVSRALKGDLQTPVCTSFGEAIELTRSGQATRPQPEATQVDSGICPYKGLEFFDCNDEDPQYFFGRERLVSQLVNHVRTRPFLSLVGASGNGKSSVLRAGLIHQLKLGKRVAGSEQWQILITRPDAQPMKNLAAAFVPLSGSQLDRAEALGRAEGLLKEGSAGLQRLVQASTAPRTVLVIDQFEEVFTRCEDDEDRLQFFDCLIGVLSACGDQLCLVIAMRADFVGKCLAQDYAGLAQQIQQNMVSVLPLTAEELRTAICKPAEQVGLSVEPDLVAAITKETKAAPGSLPLLQYTLKALWQRQSDGQLRLSDYLTLGGIEGTLDQRATEVYDRFDADEKRTVQHIFQQLTQLGEGTEDTRRRVFLENLIAEPLHSAQRVRSVVDTLANPKNRLLVTSEVVSKGSSLERRAIVDVAHEALIRHWRLLRQWIEQNRDLLRQQRRIEASTVTWQAREQARGYLLQGIPLAEAIQFREQQADAFPLSEAAKAFIKKSVWYRRRSRLKTASWLIIPAVIVVGLVEYNVRETRVKSNYVSLGSDNKIEQKQAVQDLVAGCWAQRRYSADVPRYLLERRFGNCRSLEQTNLSGADLSHVDLRDADLRDADLSHVDLSGADLSHADLSHADLFNADLFNADLSFAVLNSTDLIGADLSFAVLNSTDLIGADLSHADLSYANLSDADLIGADLSHVDLRDADLSDADLSDADLSHVDLRDADLNSTDLRQTILLNTDLRLNESMKPQQLANAQQPLICNSPLPPDIELEGGVNRDCDRLPAVLIERYPSGFETLKEAEDYVLNARQKTWE